MNDVDKFRAIKTSNRSLMREEFLRGEVELRSLPRIVFVELTRFCNLSCPMCREPGEIGKEQTLTHDLFQQIAAELFPTADIVDLRGWGESLILREWPERLALARAFGCDIRVVTNLSFHRPDVVQGLIDAGAWVGVSVDGGDQEVLHATRRGARFNLVYDNLRRLGEGYQGAGLASRLRLYTTCQRANLSTLHTIVELADACNIRTISLAPVSAAPGSLVSIAGINSAVDDAVSRARDHAAARNITLVQTANLWEGQFDKAADEPCLHPWSYCYVSYNGGVGFCDHLIGSHGDAFLMGNLKQSSFGQIWNSAQWQQLRKEHLTTRSVTAPFFSECAWCYRNRFLDFEDLLEPRLADQRQYISRGSSPQTFVAQTG